MHNIRIRQDFTVRSPSAGITGTGSGARLNIDLPGTASSGGTAEYNGYFKITDVSDSSGFKIKIADGATDGASYALIDGSFIAVAPTVLTYASGLFSHVGTYYILLRYSRLVSGAWNVYVTGDSTALSAYNNQGAYLLGRVIMALSNNKLVISSIQQDHTTGIPDRKTTSYAGEFLVVATDTEIKIMNGLSLTSPYCGYTDIAGNIPVKSFSKADALGKGINIIGLSDGTSYSVEIYLSDNPPSATDKSDPIQLATVDSSAAVRQLWTSGSIVFANSYLV